MLRSAADETEAYVLPQSLPVTVVYGVCAEDHQSRSFLMLPALILNILLPGGTLDLETKV